MKIHPFFFITFLTLLNATVFGQEHEKNLSEYLQLKKRVYSFSKLDFITSEGEVDNFPSPEELWIKTFKDKNEWSSKFDAINFEPFRGTREPRYYQEIAINNALDAIADKQQRILLTLATA